MDCSISYNEDLFNDMVLREKMEKQARDFITSDILKNLKMCMMVLPQDCQQLLQQVAINQSAIGIENLDSITLTLRQSKEEFEQIEDEYEILKLKQKNAELQVKIDKNNNMLEELRREILSSKDSLARQEPNPDNIHDHIRQLKVKITSYTEFFEKAKMTFSKLSVPDRIYPKSLASLISVHDELLREAEMLRLQADDVMLAKQARVAITRLRK